MCQGRIENRKLHVFMLGKWEVEGGLQLEMKGKRYVAMLHLTARNDYYVRGERQHLHLIWCLSSGVLEEPQWCYGCGATKK